MNAYSAVCALLSVRSIQRNYRRNEIVRVFLSEIPVIASIAPSFTHILKAQDFFNEGGLAKLDMQQRGKQL
jgi:hypothetical protein